MVNAYQVLGVSEDASLEQIRTAHRLKAQLFHPDKGGKVEDFLAIQKAFEILSHEQKREHLGRKDLFSALPLRLQPSLSTTTATLFENLGLLKDRIKVGGVK